MTRHSFTCDDFITLFPEYLEGELDDSRLADAELHLAACASCRSLHAEVASVSRDAAALPLLTPSRDLWAGIEARIGTPVVALPTVPRGRPHWQLGAIAAGLVAVTALTTWQFARREPSTVPAVALAPASGPATAPAATPPSAAVTPSGPSVDVVPVTRERAPRPEPQVTYAEEIGKLQRLLAARSNDLDPATVAIIESSIATIDAAIVEAKAALDRDPASRFLSSQLNKSLERKLALLRQAALLAPST